MQSEIESVHFERSGGFAGVQETVRVSWTAGGCTARVEPFMADPRDIELSSADGDALRAAVARAVEAGPAPAEQRGADMYQYSLEAQRADGRATRLESYGTPRGEAFAAAVRLLAALLAP